MKNFQGKVAVVTGAGDGIGRSMSLTFAKEGMKLVIVDINQESLEKVSREISEIGVEVMTKVVDVSDRNQMSKLAEDVFHHFGRVNVLCNNAGIGAGGMLHDMNLKDWDWIIGTNLYGVIYGIHFFLGRMIKSEEEGHIVNTASVAGLIAVGQEPIYSVTKHAVVALSESLSEQLQMINSKVGVSVLCPGYVNTNIVDNSERLAEAEEGLYRHPDKIKKLIEPILDNSKARIKSGISADAVAQMVIDSIQERSLYILTHPGFIPFMQSRLDRIGSDSLRLNERFETDISDREKQETKIYTHRDPGFTIAYPSNWIEQRPTFLANYDFIAVSPYQIPNIVVRITDRTSRGLNGAIAEFSEYLSVPSGGGGKIISEKLTELKDGTPAMEGEIELQPLHGTYPIVVLVLIAEKGDKIVNIGIHSLRQCYDSNMKQPLRDIAYSLVFI